MTSVHLLHLKIQKRPLCHITVICLEQTLCFVPVNRLVNRIH